MSNTENALSELKLLAQELAGRNESEAETRHKIIDIVIHGLMSWPRNRVVVEQYIRPGFADYILKKSNSEDLLFIEAKRSGIYFELPYAHAVQETSSFISISKLLSDENIKAAMTQVRAYCFDTGCEFACVTNGHEWIFFKTFEKGKRWEALQAFVIRNISFFVTEYTKAVNTFSYIAITERASLGNLLTSAPPQDRVIFRAKDRIVSYSHPITPNRLAATLRPIINRYFGVIGDSDTDFMDRCYVSQRDYQQTLGGARTLIEDSLTPYLTQFGVEQLDETGRGGRIGSRLKRSVKVDRRGEVLVLFGGKGSGKSTFVKRLLLHQPPPWLLEHAVVVIVDLLKTPEEISLVRAKIWNDLVTSLDLNKLLLGNRDTLLAELFFDRFEVAVRQELAGLPKASIEYNTRLNALVSEWKQDRPYCARRLTNYWKARSKGVIVVVDNTDQFSGVLQDYCFTSAQEIARDLDCITVISMREERFHNSKIHGVLDAFQNAGFHISSPKPAHVFRKRLDYVISLLGDERVRNRITTGSPAELRDCQNYLSIIQREFANEQSPLNSFLSACAHGDTRLSLDLFQSFLLSGYTNVEEILSAGRWSFLIHQIIKPVMIPTRYFYDEGLSSIPNIYQLRDSRHASHFTALRVLRLLAKGTDGTASSYVSMAQLKSYFADKFNMLDDFTKNTNILLRQGFIEANNRLDEYSESVDSLKITSYGLYMLNELAYFFSYLDLVCVDCGVYDEGLSNFITEAARQEYGMLSQKRDERVKIRLERVKHFIDYLQIEEIRERELFSLGVPDSDLFTYKANNLFIEERERVIESVERQRDRWKGHRSRTHRGSER